MKLLSMVLFSLTAPALNSVANADEWLSRQGGCFDWRGHWRVDRDQSGVWTGDVRFVHVGGACSPPDHSTAFDEVRAVIVGEDFFARRRSESRVCMLHGRVQGDEIRGHELCNGSASPMNFTLHLSTRDEEWRDEERRDDRGEPEYRR